MLNKPINCEDTRPLNKLAYDARMPPHFALSRNDIIEKKLHPAEMIKVVIDMLGWTKVSCRFIYIYIYIFFLI